MKSIFNRIVLSTTLLAFILLATSAQSQTFVISKQTLSQDKILDSTGSSALLTVQKNGQEQEQEQDKAPKPVGNIWKLGVSGQGTLEGFVVTALIRVADFAHTPPQLRSPAEVMKARTVSGGAFEAWQLEAGDRIIKVAGKTVRSAADVVDAINGATPPPPELTIEFISARNGQTYQGVVRAAKSQP
ncbi:MAG: hypothetical protein EBV06_06285 [Planctomycetia bacterium]|nr:hypothetical protein [Planctomycetia bacterium]